MCFSFGSRLDFSSFELGLKNIDFIDIINYPDMETYIRIIYIRMLLHLSNVNNNKQ